MRVPPISLPMHVSHPPMCLFPDSQRACVLVMSLPLIPASRFTLRFACPRPLLPRVSPAAVLYPVRHSRWSSSLSDPLLQINSLNSVLGCATGQWILNYSHVIVEFMSQPGRTLLAIARRKRADVKHFALAPMDMACDWLFSMRKVRSSPLMDDDVQIGPVLDDVTRSALWSYQLGLQTGFMPIGLHDSLGVPRGRRAAWARGRSPPQLSSRMVSGRLRGQWLALRRHLSFPSLRKFALRTEDDDGFAPMAEICAILDRTARTLRHLALGACLARHHSWDAVFQGSVIRTLTHLDLVDTRISGLVLGRVAHAAALVSLTLHGMFEDVKGATHMLLPHLHLFSFLLVGHDDQHPLYAAIAAFLAHRPLLRRLDLGSCRWELMRSLLPTLSGLKVLGVRIAHFNSAVAQGPQGALPRGVHALHLTTVVAEKDLLVFETLPLEILSFLTRTPFSPKPSPLPPSLSSRVTRAFLHLQRYKRELKASVAFGAHLSCLLTHSLPLRPPSLTLSFLSCVLFCLPLPGSAPELEASAASSMRLSSLLLLRPASIVERGSGDLGKSKPFVCVCTCNFYLQWDSRKMKASATILAHSLALPPFLLSFLPSSLPLLPFLTPSLFLLSTNTPRPSAPSPPSRSCTSKTPPRTAPSRTSSPSASLRSRQGGCVTAARGIARALPGLDFLGWHGEHYVVVRRTGERRRLNGRRENGEEGEADEEVELKELPCRRHLDCGKGVDVGGEDATWLERKDVPIDYEMPVVS
ncbi:hypothetical protein B0H14DRAFT_3885000 [Mycena olivaceomarginata]|nr:hypothetical protein B0H14DRAFT_3885000 [Mycena olivaceomarginata]